ncbi:Ig-like domain-containing protein [Thiotrichales bacterium 19X7-9]|nr:Ig-like domain-containing protein [Thiotrichales bacterium 19X7-9]
MGTDIIGEAASDESGYSVSFNALGTRVAVGATNNDDGGNNSGHVRIYDWDGASWNQLGSDIDGEAADDESGYSVALSADGDRLAIGAINNDGNGADAGHVRLYDYNGTDWVQIGSMDIDGEAAGDASGFSVSFSRDGSRLAIGAPLNDATGSDAGHVRVYNLTSTQEAVTYTEGDGAALLYPDFSVTDVDDDYMESAIVEISSGYVSGQDILSYDTVYASSIGVTGNISGNTIFFNSDTPETVTKAQYETLFASVAYENNSDDPDTTQRYVDFYVDDGDDTSNFARIIINVQAVNDAPELEVVDFSQLGADIDGEALGDESGNSVAFNDDGSIVAIGAIKNADGGVASGHVRLYQWDGSAWNQLGADIDGEAASDNSGFDVALSADGLTVAISAIGNDAGGTDRGHIRIYDFDGSNWVQRGLDIDGDVDSSQFGIGLDISSDGNIVTASSLIYPGPSSSIGLVRTFGWDGSTWIQLGSDIYGEDGATSSIRGVALSADGFTLVIGENLNDANGVNSGQARIYDFNGTNWVQRGVDLIGGAANDEFGFDVSISHDGDTIAVGSKYDALGGIDTGYTRIYDWDGANWVQRGSDIIGEALDDTDNGISVSLSADGNTIAIGTLNNDGTGADSGSTRIYHWNGSDWVQWEFDIDGEASGDLSGVSVALSADASRVVIGAPGNDGASGLDSGHARVYELTRQQTITALSYTENDPATVIHPEFLITDIDDDYMEGAVVSMTLASYQASEDVLSYDTGYATSIGVTGNIVGNVITFSSDAANTVTKIQYEELLATVTYENSSEDPDVTQREIHYIVNDGDTDSNIVTVLIDITSVNDEPILTADSLGIVQQLGSDLDGLAGSDNFGSAVATDAIGNRVAAASINGDYVRIYELDGIDWIPVGSDILAEAAGDMIYSLTMSDDGNRIAIGAIHNDDVGSNSGHVRVFDWNGSAWVQAGSDIDGLAAGDEAGFAVSFDGSGNRLVVGSPNNDTNGSNSGQVRIFDWDGSSWNQLGLGINGESSTDFSGSSVAISDDGTTVVIGAPLNDGVAGLDSGHVRVYSWDGSSWNQVGSDIEGEGSDDRFGSSVAISFDGGRIAVGAPNNDGAGTHAGSVRVFEFNGTNWVQLGGDIDGSAAQDFSGRAISMSEGGNFVVIGAEQNDGNGSESGQVRIFEWDGSTWSQYGSTINGEAAGDRLGSAVALSESFSRIIIGAPLNDGSGSNAGQLQVYDVFVDFNQGDTPVSLFENASVSTVEAGQSIIGFEFKLFNVFDGIDEKMHIDGTAIDLVDLNSGTTATNGFSYSVSVVGSIATITFDSASITTAQAAALVDAIAYENTSLAPTETMKSFRIESIQDSGGVANGGDDTNDQLALFTNIRVTNLPDAPINTVPGAQSVNEEAILAFTGANTISVTDPDGNLDTVQLEVNNGTLSVTSVAGVSVTGSGTSSVLITITTGTETDVNTVLASLTYTGNIDFNGPDTLTITSTDSTSPTNLTDVDPVTINVQPVNDEPIGTDNTITVAESSSYTFSAADFGFSDPSDGHNFESILITNITLPAGSTLLLSGLPVMNNDVINVANFGNLVFTPAPGDFGNNYASFDFQVTDDGGTVNGGEDTDQTPNTITFNVAFASILANDPLASETAVNDGQFTVDLGAVNNSGSDITVNYTVTGTASNGTDYTALTGSVIVANGQQFATIDITGIVDDGLVEGPETVIITIDSTDNVLYTIDTANDNDTVTIEDNDDTLGLNAVSITANDPNASETPTDDGQFTVDLGGVNGTGGDVTVNYTVTGTATNGTDYALLTGSVTIGDGQQTATIDITGIVDDSFIEGPETVIITLDSTDNPLFSIDASNNTDTVTIADNDSGLNSVSITAVDDTASETPTNDGQFVVDLGGINGTGSDVIVNFTVTGTAANGTDYTSIVSSVAIADGVQTANIDIRGIVDDLLIEGDETVIITLNSTNNSLFTIDTANDTDTVTILDNDSGLNQVSITATDADASETPVDDGQFTVDLGGINATGSDVTVNYSISGSAQGGSDYTLLTGSVVIANGQQSATIDVTGIIDDALIEGNETVTLTLTGTDNPTLFSVDTGNDTATVTIADNDSGLNEVSITANDPVASETATDDGQFTVDLGGVNGTGGNITINYTVTGTATGGSDYTALTGSVTIADGQQFATIDVTGIIDDSDIEGTETVIVTLDNTDNALFTIDGANNSDTVTITDNDAAPASVFITANDPNASEIAGNDGQFTVDLGSVNNTGSDVTVFYNISGNATGGSDYTALTGSIVIANGSQTATIDVTGIIDDALVEGAETVTLTLMGTDSLDFTIDTANNIDTVTIADNDSGLNSVFITATDPTASETPTDEGLFTIDLGAPNGTGGDVTVNFTVTGSATEGVDYASIGSSVVIADGVQSATVDIRSIVDDAFVEGLETVIITLDSTDNVLFTINTASDSAQVDIIDNDSGSVSIIANDALASEAGSDPGQFTVDLGAVNNTGAAITVNYSIAGSATGGSDYTALTGSVLVANGAQTATIDVTGILDDNFIEGAETVTLQLTSTSHASFTVDAANDTDTVTIADNDSGLNAVSITATDALASETPTDNGQFTIDLGGVNGTGGNVTVDFTITGTATNGVDYGPITTSVTIADGQQFATVDIDSIVNDTLIEGPETVILTLSSVDNPLFSIDLANNTDTVTIADNNSSTNVTITATDPNAAETGSDPGQFTVDLGAVNNTGSDIIVNYTVTGNASAGGDYTALTGSVTIADGQQTATIDVTGIVDDADVEGLEDVIVTLDNTNQPSLFSIGAPNFAAVFIVDNDVAGGTVSITATDPTASETPTDDGLFTIDLGSVNGTGGDVTVSYVVTGTATDGTDYTALSGSVVIGNGDQFGTIDITGIVDDAFVEGNETVVITLTGTDHGSFNIDAANNNDTVTILDNDISNNVSITATDATASETPVDDGQFTVDLGAVNNTGSDVVVNYVVTGSATEGSDYATLTGSVTIANGQQSATIDITGIVDDILIEGDETVTLQLTGTNHGSFNYRCSQSYRYGNDFR